MPTLRQRPLFDVKAHTSDVQGNSVHGNGVRQKDESLDTDVYISDHLSGRRLWIFLFSLALPTFFLLFSSHARSSSKTYALCSREGAKIYTVDEAKQVQCILVHGAYVVDTGTLSEVKRRWSTTSLLTHGSEEVQGAKRPPFHVRYVDPGAIVVPGLSDSHGHILEYGASRTMPLESAKSVQAAVAIVKHYILSDPDIRNDESLLVEGWGWDHTSWPVQDWPTAADLDSDPVIKARRVILQGKDGHALWVSSKVLQDSLPLPETVDGGVIVRDASGNPTGVVLDKAQDLIKRPPLTDEILAKRFATTIRDAIAVGLTSIHDAGFDPVSLEFFKTQSARGNLPIRIYGMTYFNEHDEYWGNATTPILAKGDGRLTARSVKMFADGALRSGGAALYEPYADNPETNGFMRIPTEVLEKFIPLFLRDGWQVNVHAIGDRANGLVLDTFEAALDGIDVAALRPRLEHAQLMTKADMERLGRLGVIASVQPTHVISDMWYAEDRLGPERLKGLYAFRTLIDSGARLALGSDFPVEDINPLAGFYAAITRVSKDGRSPHGPDGWFPDQRLTREEALRGITIDAAYASFSEETLGSLSPGKLADYVVLSHDIMTVPVKDILAVKVLATVVDGKPVYGRI